MDFLLVLLRNLALVLEVDSSLICTTCRFSRRGKCMADPSHRRGELRLPKDEEQWHQDITIQVASQAFRSHN